MKNEQDHESQESNLSPEYKAYLKRLNYQNAKVKHLQSKSDFSGSELFNKNDFLRQRGNLLKELESNRIELNKYKVYLDREIKGLQPSNVEDNTSIGSSEEVKSSNLINGDDKTLLENFAKNLEF